MGWESLTGIQIMLEIKLLQKHLVWISQIAVILNGKEHTTGLWEALRKKKKENWNNLSDLNSFSHGYNFNGLTCKLWDRNFLCSSLCFMNKFWCNWICSGTFLFSENSKTFRILWRTVGKVNNSCLLYCPQLFPLGIIISLISTSGIWPHARESEN